MSIIEGVAVIALVLTGIGMIGGIIMVIIRLGILIGASKASTVDVVQRLDRMHESITQAHTRIDEHLQQTAQSSG